MSTTADVVVIGAGIEGLSTAWQLARNGAGHVVVVERDVIGSGGTGRSSGVVRAHYGVPSLAAMAWKGVRLFETAEEQLGTDVGFEQVGYLVGVSEENRAPLEANVAMQRAIGIDVELGPPADFAELWPEADTDDFAVMAYEPRGGYGDAHRTAVAFGAAARGFGAEIRQGTAVTSILTSPDGSSVFGVETSAGVIEAPNVVVAAGPWSVTLLAEVGIDLPVRAQREQLLVLRTGLDPTPRPVLSDLTLLQYLRAERNGDILVGNSDHSDPEFADPDHYENSADWSYVESASAKFARRFGGLADFDIVTTYSGCYDVTPDYNPVISMSPVEGLFVCAGFSGHGFKISPAVGELMCDLVLETRSLDPLVKEDDFRLSRFAEGQLTVSRHSYAGAGQLR